MTRLGFTLTFVLGASLISCAGTVDDGDTPDPTTGNTSGGIDDTFDHDNDSVSVWTLLDRLQKEGPPEFTSRVHSCPKIRYATLGNVLRGLGVAVDANNPGKTTAAGLYKAAANSIGSPNYMNRIRENVGVTTSGASALFDIFAAGADEITTALPNLDRCKINGAPGPAMFDTTTNQCNPQAIKCLIGAPARPEHVAICNRSLTDATTPAIGKRLAVATLLAAAYTCE